MATEPMDTTKNYVYKKEETPVLPSYKYYDNRLETFGNWKKTLPTKKQLAKAGFVFLGKKDTTTCFACGLNLSFWERKDEPMTEHKKYSPSCEFVKIVGVWEERHWFSLSSWLNKRSDYFKLVSDWQRTLNLLFLNRCVWYIMYMMLWNNMFDMIEKNKH